MVANNFLLLFLAALPNPALLLYHNLCARIISYCCANVHSNGHAMYYVLHITLSGRPSSISSREKRSPFAVHVSRFARPSLVPLPATAPLNFLAPSLSPRLPKRRGGAAPVLLRPRPRSRPLLLSPSLARSVFSWINPPSLRFLPLLE